MEVGQWDRALPDFHFNETVIQESEPFVKIQVNLTGTHLGVIDYQGILRGIPIVQPTGKWSSSTRSGSTITCALA